MPVCYCVNIAVQDGYLRYKVINFRHWETFPIRNMPIHKTCPGIQFSIWNSGVNYNDHNIYKIY